MKKLDKQAEKYFRKLIALLEDGALYYVVRKPALMRFVVEPLYTFRRNGLPEAKLWSMAFRGTVNGDSMCDPEMCFAVTEEGVYPYMYQNDYVATYDAVDLDNWYLESPLQASMADFANSWMASLKAYEMHTGPVEQYW